MGCCDSSNIDRYEIAPPLLLEKFPISKASSHSDLTQCPVTERGSSTMMKTDRKKPVPRIRGELSSYYTIGKEIGEGSFGKIYHGTNRENGAVRAIKVVAKTRIHSANMYNEADLLKTLDHPHIITIYEVIESEETIGIVIELCEGGSLFERVISRMPLSEDRVALYMSQIVSGVAYCHNNSIVHRDLKLENILFENESFDSPLKIIDFGVSSVIAKEEMLKAVIGSVYYIAPEVILGRYNEKCDIWSCGVIMYILLCGKPPFAGKTSEEILRRICKGLYTFQDAHWNGISNEAKALVKKMLTIHSSARPSAEELLQSPWFNEGRSQGNSTPSFQSRRQE